MFVVRILVGSIRRYLISTVGWDCVVGDLVFSIRSFWAFPAGPRFCHLFGESPGSRSFQLIGSRSLNLAIKIYVSAKRGGAYSVVIDYFGRIVKYGMREINQK